MLAQFGGLDKMKGFSDPEAAQAFADKMAAAGNPIEMHSYPSAGHGFMNALTSVGAEMLASECRAGSPLICK